MDRFDVVVTGAGPAGLFCALHTAGYGARVLVLEKNQRPGAKLLLSGSGQCNLTHNGDIRNFPGHYGSHGKFLRHALMALTNKNLEDFFLCRGLAMETERNGKVFPTTRKSEDVLHVLVTECKKSGAVLRCSEPVTGIRRHEGSFTVTTSSASYKAASVVLTTGGASYPRCGTTGDGYRLAETLGQPVTETSPALTPLIIRPFPFASLAGLSFERMRFSVWRHEKKVAEYAGDVLITHRGLSGPGILDASRDIRPGDVVRLSFISPLRWEDFSCELRKRAAAKPTMQVRTLLSEFPVPERLGRLLPGLSGIPEGLTCAHLSADMRSALAKNCAQFPLEVSALGGYDVAMATRGGIDLDEVNPKTMESKVVPGLFFAGEVLDIDGDTGGYNLQAAFSTGFLAAQGVRKRLAGKK